jgi:DNA-binding response OmpR family regulator
VARLAKSETRKSSYRSLGLARVLVVDDDHDIRRILELVFFEFGFEVHLAGTGNEAKKRLEEQRYDLVVLDLAMPEGDGFSVLEHIREWEERPRVAVLTARTKESDRQRAYELGAIDLTTKPFDPYELATKLSGLMILDDEDLRKRVERDLRTSRLVQELDRLIKRNSSDDRH